MKPTRPLEVRTVQDRIIRLDPVELRDPEELSEINEFSPEVHPRQMMRLGIFEGYGLDFLLRPETKVPREWIEELRMSRTGVPDPGINHFGVATQGYDEKLDPWFAWYVAFTLGTRRMMTDASEIVRWERKRKQLRDRVVKDGFGDPKRALFSRQRLLEWACDPYFDCRPET